MNTLSMSTPTKVLKNKIVPALALSAMVFVSSMTTSTIVFAEQNNHLTPSSKATTKASNLASNHVEMVSLNKSTLDELLTLKGIGEKKAQAILTYREQVGGFSSIEELINIKGVGEKILNDNKSRLTM
jgi:competence protein ComEA